MLSKFLEFGSAAAAPFITCSAVSEWKDHFPLAFKRSIVREFNSQATDELGAPQGPSIHLALSCFVQQTLNRWAFVLTSSHLLTHPAPNEVPPPQWQCAPENWYSHICVTCFMSVLHSLRAKWWKTPRRELFHRDLQPNYIFVSCDFITEESIFSFATIRVRCDGRAHWKYLMVIKILGFFFSSGQFVNHLALWGGSDHVS